MCAKRCSSSNHTEPYPHFKLNTASMYIYIEQATYKNINCKQVVCDKLHTYIKNQLYLHSGDRH